VNIAVLHANTNDLSQLTFDIYLILSGESKISFELQKK